MDVNLLSKRLQRTLYARAAAWALAGSGIGLDPQAGGQPRACLVMLPPPSRLRVCMRFTHSRRGHQLIEPITQPMVPVLAVYMY